MTIGGRAIGASMGIVYLRAEYAYLRAHLNDVIHRRREAGLLGSDVGGVAGFDFDIVVARGSLGRMLSASWMASRASSVASLDFCGLFAMSVVASFLRRTIATARSDQRAAPRAR